MRVLIKWEAGLKGSGSRIYHGGYFFEWDGDSYNDLLVADKWWCGGQHIQWYGEEIQCISFICFSASVGLEGDYLQQQFLAL
ncbi:hypothetical protein RIF29_25157 [Crotalaria pallida]|uniref:Uncharacterized protein n=1 Tax=Crotalaria pallida TaxID=3830 RepID=A0AAN9ETA1_CROPI